MMLIQSKEHYKKFSIILTLVFLIATSYVAFFHHTAWIVDQDGIGYLHGGESILAGNGKNIKFFDAPFGGPIFFALVNSVFDNGFTVMKVISIISGGGSVYLSYYILRNVVRARRAFVGQLFFAFSPWVGFFSIQAEIVMVPIIFVMLSLYFITKKELTKFDIFFSAIFVAISFMVRTQALVMIFTIIITLMIFFRNDYRKNAKFLVIFLIIFCITLSPLILYNYSTHGVIFDHDISFYLQFISKYQTPEWKERVTEIATNGEGTLEAIFVDFDLFLKNYFYNLFYNSPSKFFNVFDKINISPVPIIPIIGVIPVVGGIAYILSNYKKTRSQNVLPLLLLPLIFWLLTSMVFLSAGEQFLIIGISFALFSAVFFSEMLPEKILKNKNQDKTKSENGEYKKKLLICSIINLILLSNFGYSYVLYRATSSFQAYENISTEIEYFLNPELVEKRSDVLNDIWKILEKDPYIENSYIMAPQIYFVPHGQAKLLFAHFNEGPSDDTIENYITRDKWKFTEKFHSNIHSIPADRLDQNNPIPTYINHIDRDLDGKQHEFIKILNDPLNKEIPSNFENIYFSEKHGITVYKIND